MILPPCTLRESADAMQISILHAVRSGKVRLGVGRSCELPDKPWPCLHFSPINAKLSPRREGEDGSAGTVPQMALTHF
jgi:hypothetical protein